MGRKNKAKKKQELDTSQPGFDELVEAVTLLENYIIKRKVSIDEFLERFDELCGSHAGRIIEPEPLQDIAKVLKAEKVLRGFRKKETRKEKDFDKSGIMYFLW